MNSNNIEHAVDTVNIFIDLLPETAEELSREQPDIQTKYKSFVLNNKSKISDLWQSGLSYYLNFYNVYPENDEYDEFKNIYFLGVAIAEELQTSGLSDLCKIQLSAMVKLLDYRLSTAGAARAQLTYRLRNAINNGALTNDFGRFGLYVLYKCLYNAATEKNCLVSPTQTQ